MKRKPKPKAKLAKKVKLPIKAKKTKKPKPKAKRPAPVVNKKPRLKPETELKQNPAETIDKCAAFLAALIQTASVRRACAMAAISHDTIYRKKKTDPLFLEAFNEAMEIGVETLESAAFERAIHGTQKPVFSFGKQCGSITEYSDTLTIFLLKGRKREIYGDSIKHQGDPDAPLQFEQLGVKGAVDEIASILAAAGLKPTSIEGAEAPSDATAMGTATGAADTRPTK